MSVKRLIAMLLVFAMLAGVPAPGLAEGDLIRKRAVTVYLGGMDAWYNSLPLYFMDGVNDLPWIELRDWCDFANFISAQFFGDTGYHLECLSNGELVTLARENGYTLEVDFSDDSLTFLDYDAFLHASGDSALLDLLSETGFNERGEAQLFQRVPQSAYDRYGRQIVIYLSEYDIALRHEADGYYVPAQTLSDLLLAPQTGCSLFYNGKAAFFANAHYFGQVGVDLTPLGEYYYSARPRRRSEALAEYGYGELCLMLDCLYGLRETHDIEGFRQLFEQIGFDSRLQDPDPEEADLALYDFIDLYLDDLHSHFSGYSWFTGQVETEGSFGMASLGILDNIEYYAAARKKYYPGEVPFYEEVDNTAYVTFDSFDSSGSSLYYQALSENGKLPQDTIGLIIYAHNRIYRRNSPVKNVVIDLSLNTGGSLDAALFVLGWVLGNAAFSVMNTFTGAMSTASYRADVNLDRTFNANDVVDTVPVYCLISPVSFSCGNLVPAAFKSSGRVKLLGCASGGGSCTVQNVATAWGTYFEISSNKRMSFLKNGVFYDIDQGIEPDYPIARVEHFYDRAALTEYINGLY